MAVDPDLLEYPDDHAERPRRECDDEREPAVPEATRGRAGGHGGTARREDQAHQVADLVERLGVVAALPREQRPDGHQRRSAAEDRRRDRAQTTQSREPTGRDYRSVSHPRPEMKI